MGRRRRVYSGILDNPIVITKAQRAELGALSNAEATRRMSEIVTPQWDARFAALCEHYDCDRDDWASLALELAWEHVPGFAAHLIPRGGRRPLPTSEKDDEDRRVLNAWDARKRVLKARGADCGPDRIAESLWRTPKFNEKYKTAGALKQRRYRAQRKRKALFRAWLTTRFGAQ
jgi:hypothetical protein